MEKKSFSNLYAAYKAWVCNNPNVVTEVETVLTWSSYFVAGKVNKSPIVSELVYSLSKLLSLYNDKLIKEAYGNDILANGLKDRIKLCLTIIHYTEVFIELVIKRKWGSRGKWLVATILQLIKCSSALILLYKYREMPLQHPPIPVLQRRKLSEESGDKDCESFTLRRTGRVIRRVDGSPPVALRDWQPVQNRSEESNLHVKDVIYAETIHVLKPIIHLLAMKVFGPQAWRQWLVALGLDIASLKLYGRHSKNLSQEQRIEVSRRKLGLVLYLLRSPMYRSYSSGLIENALNNTAKKIPMLSFLCHPIVQYLNHWQDIYFYMWAN